MKKIIKNFRENWITYLFEILVVIIGIMGAFGLNKWNEERKEDILKKAMINHIKSNLEEDRKSLQEGITNETAQ